MNANLSNHFPMKAAVGAILLFALNATPSMAQPGVQWPPPDQMLSPDRLDDLVAPIALYPDPLLSQVLVAATYPLELVHANQWLQRNSRLSGPAITQAAQQQNWDPSIQALVVFPDLVRRLNQDINWTTNLGNAFLNQQDDLMDAVQRMRFSASQAGRLTSSDQQIVFTINESGRSYIEIEPADPQMMYLPEYDPNYIWGAPRYYPYANWNYPRYSRGAYFSFSIGIPIGLYFGGGWDGWGAWGWNPGWGRRQVIVNDNFMHRYNYTSSRNTTLNGRRDWSHDSSHRQGVPYSNPATYDRYRSGDRQSVQPRAPTLQAPTGRETYPQPGRDGVGNRQIPSNPAGRNGGAFGGVRDGGAVRTQSDHGYSSLGPARSAPVAPVMPPPAPVVRNPEPNRGNQNPGPGRSFETPNRGNQNPAAGQSEAPNRGNQNPGRGRSAEAPNRGNQDSGPGRSADTPNRGNQNPAAGRSEAPNRGNQNPGAGRSEAPNRGNQEQAPAKGEDKPNRNGRDKRNEEKK